ncbi:MAG: hypothetical protein KDK08_05385 [Rhizobiaceae bacterium]|nr:hypothetical protein [Rhizobiaceae bacterium]MCC0000902.1 hypothetical protein [Methylobacteriaceae bacterium]
MADLFYRDTTTGKSESITQVKPEVEALFQSIKAAFHADAAYQKMRASVPDYTGQWEPKDFYGPALDTRNRAINAIFDAFMELLP